jgi:endonuclease/exonuclease/phosphatase family metal-dependent hydrolase
MAPLKILSFNAHKFLTPLKRKNFFHELKDQIKNLAPDFVFLQEFRGAHPSLDLDDGFGDALVHFADQVWPHFAYGKNAVYSNGHHGNALLSRFPIVSWDNTDISNHSFERRGVIHAACSLIESEPEKLIHLFCTHFDLSQWGRNRQTEKLLQLIRKRVKVGEKVIVAGDFNDWNSKISETMSAQGLIDSSQHVNGGAAKTYPWFSPTLPLDRIFFKNIECVSLSVLNSTEWLQLSDHLPLLAYFEIK